MKSYNLQQPEEPSGIQSLFDFLKAVSALLGIVAIIVGLIFAMRLFFLVFGALESPEGMAPYFEKWVEALGGEKLNFTLNGDAIPLANILAVMVLGGGAIILMWISMGLITTGAKILSWILCDRETVKRILAQALSKSAKYGMKDKGESDIP